jgi:hypothetical protein
VAQLELNVFKLESGNYEFDDSEIKQRYDNQKQLNAQLHEQKRWLEHELEEVSGPGVNVIITILGLWVILTNFLQKCQFS